MADDDPPPVIHQGQQGRGGPGNAFQQQPAADVQYNNDGGGRRGAADNQPIHGYAEQQQLGFGLVHPGGNAAAWQQGFQPGQLGGNPHQQPAHNHAHGYPFNGGTQSNIAAANNNPPAQGPPPPIGLMHPGGNVAGYEHPGAAAGYAMAPPPTGKDETSKGNIARNVFISFMKLLLTSRILQALHRDSFTGKDAGSLPTINGKDAGSQPTINQHQSLP